MRDPQVLARGSKTATVVVLVVFLQLLVIAVLGLGAITRDRREGTREALLKADADALATADDMLRDIRSTFAQAARNAVALRKPDELVFSHKHAEGKLWNAIYQVDGAGSVWWFTGVERLWMPPGLILAKEEESAQREEDAAELVGEFHDAQLAGDHALAVDRLWLLVDAHALWLDRASYPKGYPKGVGWAVELVEQAWACSSQGSSGPFTLQRVLLKALETEAINRGRVVEENPFFEAELDQIPAKIAEKLACAVDGEELTQVVAAFRAARRDLDRLKPALDEAAQGVRALGRERQRPAVVIEKAGQTFAAAAVPDSDRVVLAHLDEERARQYAASLVDAPRLARLSLRLDILPAKGAVEGEPLRVHDFASAGELELPFRAALYREAAPPLPSGGPTEAFYLGIIGLAALGLIVGGVILLRAWRREVRLARLKADFVSNLSHELKTPLTSISLFTEMLQEGKLASEEEKREGLAVLAQESQRLQRIVARMIDVARREVRGTPYDLAPGNLNEPVREAALRFRRIVTEPGLDLVVSLSPEPLPVRMDAAAVDDAVTNLLSNAWKYKRGDRARIEVRTARRRGKAEITVADDGIGIPRHERKRVFEMFYRAENFLTRNVAGTGLGLALVRTIVRAHRGRIRLEPGQGGVGSLFRLRMPLARRRSLAVAPAPSVSPAPLTSRAESPS
jgi:signal transduction histidine kinase